MSETAITVTKSEVNLEWERPENLALIRQTVAPGLTDPEFAVFCHVARARRLDPLQKQIYALKRRTWNPDTKEYENRMVLQVGIDGFRSIANRTELYMPSDKLPKVEGEGTPDLRVTVWVEKWHAASNQWKEFGATAYYREFVQTHKNQAGKLEPVTMWEKMPLGQTEKCAEAKVLRRGWPEELGQFYIPEETSTTPGVEVLPPEAGKRQNHAERDLGTLKVSTEPNRGHGHEGTQRTQEQTLCAECRTLNGHTAECSLNPKNAQTTKATQKSKREAWETQPGHDPKIHISFNDAIQLFEIQRNLKISDEQIKSLLDREFEIQHRYLIRQDQYQLVLDAIEREFGKRPEPKGKVVDPAEGIF